MNIRIFTLFLFFVIFLSFEVRVIKVDEKLIEIPSFRQRKLLKGRDAITFEELDLLIMIASAYNNVRKRNAVRRTTISRIPFEEYAVQYYFFITKPDSIMTQSSLLEENATHGDLSFAHEGFADFDTSHKVWMELRLASSRSFGRPKFLLKCDDDHFIFYEKMLKKLMTLPPTNLIWGRQGSGYGPPGSIYTNNAVLMSMDVVDRVALDERASTCGKEDDHCIGTSATRHGAIIVDDHQWMNDDTGQANLCLCAPWTLESDVIVVHHVHPEVMEAYVDDKELFSRMRFPHRNYA
jgi:hypothetical protein